MFIRNDEKLWDLLVFFFKIKLEKIEGIVLGDWIWVDKGMLGLGLELKNFLVFSLRVEIVDYFE